MTPCESTNPQPARTDPFRWSRADSALVFDHFAEPDPCSQRQYAAENDIPRSTLGYWLRRDDPADADPVAAFLHTTAGEDFLRGIVLAAILAFHERGACGIRRVSEFLQLSHLDCFVAASRGALQGLAQTIETRMGAFDDFQRPLLAKQMQPKDIALCTDENFHGPDPCLVGIEPVSNFILLECYRLHRDADTWNKAINDSVRGMPVRVVLLNSDLAAGLVCCAEKGLGVLHSPDLFHGQRDLLKPLWLPLTRPIQQGHKDLEKAKHQSDQCDSLDEGWELVQNELRIAKQLEQAQQHQSQALQQVRGLSDDYHPFDRQSGRPVTAEAVSERLGKHLDEVEKVVEQAGLGNRAAAAVTKTRAWLGTLVAVVAWFWSMSHRRVEELQLSKEQESVVYESLLAGLYWERVAEQARTPEERKRLAQLACNLKKEATQPGGPLSSLTEQEKSRVQNVAQQCAGVFARSSSCVEGRNGRLSLHHHGQGRLGERKLKALTVLHNYGVKRPDGTTAAQRFFGVEHPDLFSWLLQRMPDLPRPASKRPKKTDQSTVRPA